jgi:hypothetical protein
MIKEKADMVWLQQAFLVGQVLIKQALAKRKYIPTLKQYIRGK